MPVSQVVFPLFPPQFRPHCPSPMLLRRVADLGESLAKAVSSIRLPALLNPAAVSDTCQCYSMFCNGTVPCFPPQCLLSTFCHAFLRRAACIGMWLSEAVVKPYVFLRGLLLLAGDVERNPGPVQGRQRAASWQYTMYKEHTQWHAVV